MSGWANVKSYVQSGSAESGISGGKIRGGGDDLGAVVLIAAATLAAGIIVAIKRGKP